MAKSKEIYLLYKCDEWKSRSSKVLVMATTSKEKLDTRIKKYVRRKDMTFSGETGKAGIELFTHPLSIFAGCYGRLGGGLVEIVKDGQEIR